MSKCKILHVLSDFYCGGALRSAITYANESEKSGLFEHSFIALQDLPGLKPLPNSGSMKFGLFTGYPAFFEEVKSADIVQVEWWGSPRIQALFEQEWPECRLLNWCHVAGDSDPHFISSRLIDFSDFIISASPRTQACASISALLPEVRLAKTAMIYDIADFSRLSGLTAMPHEGFNIGYVGTVDFVKMHPDFARMSASIDIPDARFLVCGEGRVYMLEEKVRAIGDHRFEICGYVDDIRTILCKLDVYGYPLCEDTYAAGELNIQEAMRAGVVPVVFPHGGLRDLVIDNYTGLVVQSALEYRNAIEYLYKNPEERARLSRNAQEYARQIFDVERLTLSLHGVYGRLMDAAPRKRTWARTSGEEGRGAGAFIGSLYNPRNRNLFMKSRFSKNPDEFLSVEKDIIDLPPVLRNGGIETYSDFYRMDAFLRLWAGLSYLADGNFSRALADFDAAVAFGLPHSRGDLYSAIAQKRAGDEASFRSIFGKLELSDPMLLDSAKNMGLV